MPEQLLLPTHGDQNIFKLGQIKLKGARNEEVKVKVHFSGINFADILMRQGLYPDAPAFPFTPGYEFSGEIIEVGATVKNFKIGDKVFGGCFFGGYSSELNVPANQVRRLADNWTLEDGASLPVSFLTAYVTLFDLARIKNGDKILIDCITGSLGGMCIELLKGIDCDIIGLTSSKSKIQLMLNRGIETYTHDQFYNNKSLNNFDFILNSQGGGTITAHYNRLGPAGRIVVVGASSAVAKGKRSLLKAIKMLFNMPKFKPVQLMNDNKGVMGINALRLFEMPEFLFERLDLAENFDLKFNVDKIFDAKDVADAHAYIEDRKSKGKVLLKWN
ncbi:MAG: zinc-binding dehydrogenase [Bacteriovoracaceae bacterium]|jgi:synaptic vesicle membrane protein VAT-1|nr:zinc-binding dehydrogenase [Bacteriovoracaceae bacterium]